METKSSNLSVLLEEGVKRGRVKMDLETEIRYDDDDDCAADDDCGGDDDHDDNLDEGGFGHRNLLHERYKKWFVPE